MNKKEHEIAWLILLIGVFLSVFLIIPIGKLALISLTDSDGVTLNFYQVIVQNTKFIVAFKNSVFVSLLAALISTLLGLLLSYAVNMTNISRVGKSGICLMALFPMLLPTITHGFTLTYFFGKQGVLAYFFGTNVLGEIYGFKGLLFGYVIYTLPVSFLLINNTFKYLDKNLFIVSLLMQDNAWRRFIQVLLRPLFMVMVASCVQAFILSFTDFGIPASLGGQYSVIATYLYQEMLGANPSFPMGATIAVSMIMPSVLCVFLLQYLDRFNVRYPQLTMLTLPKNRLRDMVAGVASYSILIVLFTILSVMWFIPFVDSWPYNLSLNLTKVRTIVSDDGLLNTYKNSLLVAFLSAMLGTLICFIAALFTGRSGYPKFYKNLIDLAALMTNSIPGMILGISYLFIFSGTMLQNTILIIVICNVVHFFSTPYLMAKNALLKMNANWEVAAMLMGDTWFQSIWKVVIPNSLVTLIQMFNYLFVNAMVTVSAVIFITGVHTMVITTKINELQQFSKFDEIFILSNFILLTNLVMLAIGKLVSKRFN